jgi:hypothetical protein
MINENDELADKAKPEGNTNEEQQGSPDVKKDGWSAEEIAEQSAHKDGTEVKQEIEQGKETQRKEGR